MPEQPVKSGSPSPNRPIGPAAPGSTVKLVPGTTRSPIRPGPGLRPGATPQGSVDAPAKSQGHVAPADTSICPYKRGFGFVLVLIAASLGVLGEAGWRDLISWGDLAAKLGEWGATDRVLQFLYDWLRLILISTTAIWAVSFLRTMTISTLLRALFAAGMMVLSAQAAVTLCGVELPWQGFVVGAFGIAYLIYSERRTAALRFGTFLGLVLVAVAAIGAVNGWFDLPAQAEQFGFSHRLPPVVTEYSQEFTWAIILILATLGVSRSRTRPVHVLNAAMLIALAYYCIHSASVVEGGMSKIEVWRWVLAGELVVVGAVLLHAALGVGGLTVAFAMTWMFLGANLYKEIGTWSLMRTMSNEFTFAVAAAPGDPNNAARAKLAQNPLANWGLPVGGPAVKSKGPGPVLARTNPRMGPERSPKAQVKETPNKQSIRTPRGRPTETSPARRHVSEAELDAARDKAIASLMLSRQQESVREVTRQVWMGLTAILAGMILVSGCNMLSENRGLRVSISALLWAGFAFAIGALWMLVPRETDQSWLSWLSNWTQSGYRIHAVWTVCLGAAAIAGTWALALGGRRTKWIYIAITCIFIGTVLSLLGVAVFIRFGGFSPLPVWTYAAMAIGQSVMAWVLMMHLSLRAREPLVPATSAAAPA